MSPRRPALLEVAVLAVLVAVCAPACDASHKLPSNFKRCRAKDPNISSCLRVAVEDAFHKMKNGIPSLGMVPLQPLKVDRIKVSQGQGAVSLNMDMSNILIHGLADTTMTNYSADIPNGILRTESFHKEVRIDFDNKMDGRILVLPIRGAGPGSVVLGDLTVHHYLKFLPTTKKDGKLYWNIQTYTVKFVPKRLSMNFKGLFGGDGRLGDQINLFLNQNALVIFEEIGGAFEDAFGAVLKDGTARLFSKVPFNDIFI